MWEFIDCLLIITLHGSVVDGNVHSFSTVSSVALDCCAWECLFIFYTCILQEI